MCLSDDLLYLSFSCFPTFSYYSLTNWQVGVLLEHTVGNPDSLYIVNMVPNGLEIPRLVISLSQRKFVNCS